MKKPILMSIISLMLFSFLGIGTIYYQQENMLFQKTALPKNHVFSYEEPFEELFLETDKHTRLNALYFYVDQPKGVVLYFHGRGENLDDNIGKLSHKFTDRGYNLFIVDYRGFGKSQGVLSERAMYHDGEYCYNYLLSAFPEKQIVIYGCSLGTAVATHVASHHDPKSLILEAPYFSILDLSPQQVPYLPKLLIPMLLKYHFRTDKWITKVDAPIHIFHGVKDELIPYDSSTRLVKLIEDKPDVTLVSIDQGRHNNLSHFPEYHQKMDRILN